MLRDDLFGGLALAWGNEPLPAIPRRAACSLLAYLLIFHDRLHSCDRLSDTFWPHLSDATAPRDADLVAARRVSLATLHCELAARRTQGYKLPTRWQKMTTQSWRGYAVGDNVETLMC